MQVQLKKIEKIYLLTEKQGKYDPNIIYIYTIFFGNSALLSFYDDQYPKFFILSQYKA